MNNLIICNDDGDSMPISPEALLIQGVLFGVYKDGDQTSRRVLNGVLTRVNELLDALHELSKDKSNVAKIDRYQKAKRACETDVMYYGKSLPGSPPTVVQGELFADTTT